MPLVLIGLKKCNLYKFLYINSKHLKYHRVTGEGMLCSQGHFCSSPVMRINIEKMNKATQRLNKQEIFKYFFV